MVIPPALLFIVLFAVFSLLCFIIQKKLIFVNKCIKNNTHYLRVEKQSYSDLPDISQSNIQSLYDFHHILWNENKIKDLHF